MVGWNRGEWVSGVAMGEHSSCNAVKEQMDWARQMGELPDRAPGRAEEVGGCRGPHPRKGRGGV